MSEFPKLALNSDAVEIARGYLCGQDVDYILEELDDLIASILAQKDEE